MQQKFTQAGRLPCFFYKGSTVVVFTRSYSGVKALPEIAADAG